MSTVLIDDYIKQLREIQNERLWMGQNFSQKLSGISEEEAFTTPHNQLHSIAELIAHLTVWRTETLEKLKTGAGNLTDDMDINWRSNAVLKKYGWDTIWNDYQKSGEALTNYLETKTDSFLEETYYDPDFKGTYPYRFVVQGMIHHDIYHLGQIGLVIKFMKKA